MRPIRQSHHYTLTSDAIFNFFDYYFRYILCMRDYTEEERKKFMIEIRNELTEYRLTHWHNERTIFVH